MAASDKGILYEGAFGVRSAGRPEPMTVDTLFRIASMTKVITSIAAMQLVEEGSLELDQPVPDIDPTLTSPQVLEGFDASARPRLRPAVGAITLRQLLSHTAGFTYEMWDGNTIRYMKHTGTPSFMTSQLAGLRLPLAFDPGVRWNYGISTDWVGRIVESVRGQRLDDCFREHIFAPLGMKDTGYAPSPEQRSRLASVHQRMSDGTLKPRPPEREPAREFLSGGGGLFSTAPDYLALLQMLLRGGNQNGVEILRPETVALMAENQIGGLPAGIMTSAMPELSNDVNLMPGVPLRWGLGFMINLEAGPAGRSAGSLSWAGIYNTYYWIDRSRKVIGVLMTQVQPFADAAVLHLYDRFERFVYGLAASG